MQTLKDLTILDFTRLLPGPLATNMLALMGAKVVKIEHPERADYARRQPPFVGGESTLFHALNFAKNIQRIDFRQEKGRKEILELVKKADLVIEQFRPGVMASWKLGYDDLKAVKKDIIYVSLSGYGQDGPYRDRAGHDLNYLAYSGILSLTRDREGRPVIPGVQIADIAGGSYMAFSACLAALLHRERSGEGGYVDVSMLDGLMPLLTIPATQHWGGVDPYAVNFLSGALVNYNIYECADGRWIALGALEMKFWNNFCDLAGRPDWIRNNQLELSILVFPKNEVEDLFQSKTQAEWMALADGQDVCLSPVRTMEEVEQDEHLRHRGQILSPTNNAGSRLKGFGLPFSVKRSE